MAGDQQAGDGGAAAPISAWARGGQSGSEAAIAVLPSATTCSRLAHARGRSSAAISAAGRRAAIAALLQHDDGPVADREQRQADGSPG